MTEESVKNRLVREVTDKWWIVLLKGIAAIILGLLFITNVVALILALGVYLLAAGALDIFYALTAGGKEKSRWWGVAGGVLQIVVGGVILAKPIYATTFFAALSVYFVAFASLFAGFMAIIRGVQLRKYIENEWTLIIAGVLLLLYGGLLLIDPEVSAVALAWAVGIASLVGGVLLIIFAFRLRQLGARLN